LVAAYDADPNRISVIPWAPDELVLQQCRALQQDPERVAGVAKRYDLDHPWLLNFSGSSRRKNAYRIIDAVAELPPEIRMRCVVALTGCEPQAFRNELRTRAERLGVGSSVRLLGFVPHEDLPSLLVGARGLLIPSLGEGFGLPILDAFAADVPVLAAATSSLPEVAGEAAVYCNPRSTRSVADGIKTLLDPKEAGRLRLLGRQRVRVFSWEHTARLMAETFERVLTARALRTRYRLQPRLRLIPAPSKGGPL
jgi:alpha-1,3-rhamnosyl/mannosyltransferase